MATAPISEITSPLSYQGYLEQEICPILDSMYFEPNDCIARANIRHQIDVLMSQTKIPNLQDWMVVCDETNNSPRVIESNMMIVDLHLEFRNRQCEMLRFVAGKPSYISSIDVDITDPMVGSTSQGGSVGSGSVGTSGGFNGTFSINQSGHHGGYGPVTVNAPQGAIGQMVGQLTSPMYLDSKISLVDPISTNPKLPAITFHTHNEAGTPIEMTLEPESTLSAHEALQLSMLIHASMVNPSAFSAYLFVQKNHLERHFKYKA